MCEEIISGCEEKVAGMEIINGRCGGMTPPPPPKLWQENVLFSLKLEIKKIEKKVQLKKKGKKTP